MTGDFFYHSKMSFKNEIHALGVLTSLVSWYCEGYRFGILEDLTFRISEGLDQN